MNSKLSAFIGSQVMMTLAVIYGFDFEPFLAASFVILAMDWTE